MNSTTFVNKPASFLKFMTLIFELFKNVFQRNANSVISVVLESKQQKAIQLLQVFLDKFAINQLLLLHFS